MSAGWTLMLACPGPYPPYRSDPCQSVPFSPFSSSVARRFLLSAGVVMGDRDPRGAAVTVLPESQWEDFRS